MKIFDSINNLFKKIEGKREAISESKRIKRQLLNNLTISQMKEICMEYGIKPLIKQKASEDRRFIYNKSREEWVSYILPRVPSKFIFDFLIKNKCQIEMQTKVDYQNFIEKYSELL